MSGPLIVRLRDEHMDHHRVRQSWFVGPDAEHLQLAGTLVLSVGEWRLLGTALLGGAEIMPRHLVVELDATVESEVIATPGDRVARRVREATARALREFGVWLDEECPHEPDEHAEGFCDICDYAFAVQAEANDRADRIEQGES